MPDYIDKAGISGKRALQSFVHTALVNLIGAEKEE